MKKYTLFFLISFAIAEIHAQNYQITFAGTGASNSVDTVKVENLTQSTHTILGGGDILHLTGAVGIDKINIEANNNIQIYPNPTAGICSIDFEATAQGNTSIELYDITGKRILQVQELLSKGNHKYLLSGISNGIYFIRIASDKYSYTSKLISSNAISGTPEMKHVGANAGSDRHRTVSNSEKKKGLNNSKSIVDMQYTTGDILKFTGKSGIYRTVFMLVPTQDTSIPFNFVACTDADNNNYTVVQIDTLIWMAENLNTTHFRNGDAITDIQSNALWAGSTTEAYCDYENLPSYGATYGKLYNWYAVDDSRNVAPSGWHVATDAEWTALMTFLGGETVAGGKLKETDTIHWVNPNIGATNISGFTALPGGDREFDGTFQFIKFSGAWWTASIFNVGYAWSCVMNCNEVLVGHGGASNIFGRSVRCVKD